MTGMRGRAEDHSVELKMRWKDLSLKTICEDDEWKAQFAPIRDKFTKCLGLKKIIIDEDDADNNDESMEMMRGDANNPYCRISKTWDACSHYLKALNCIEPNSEELMKDRRDGMAGMIDEDDKDNTHFDPENMNSMVRPYRMQCEMAKFAYNYGPYGPHGHGMDYFGDYGMPPDMDPEVPPNGDL